MPGTWAQFQVGRILIKDGLKCFLWRRLKKQFLKISQNASKINKKRADSVPKMYRKRPENVPETSRKRLANVPKSSRKRTKKWDNHWELRLPACRTAAARVIDQTRQQRMHPLLIIIFIILIIIVYMRPGCRLLVPPPQWYGTITMGGGPVATYGLRRDSPGWPFFYQNLLIVY